jgi:hypothetical protein
MIQNLIDRPDTFEVVRDKIALILATETASQQAKAVEEGKDPELWKLRIYTERSNAWEAFQDDNPVDKSPIVNVWFDSEAFPKNQGSTVDRQTARGMFNIDIVAVGVSGPDGLSGQKPGDKEAAFAAQRGLRLVRSIMMASNYTYLELRGLVAGRWPSDVSTFQPQTGARSAQHIIGARLALEVKYNEFAPQYEGEELEQLNATINRALDGEILIEAEYDYT